MLIDGIDLSAVELTDYTLAKVAGRTLIIDGDGPAYVAAAKAKTVATALRNYQTRMLEMMYLAKAVSANVHLTHERSYKAGRFNIKAIKPYQGQRSSEGKPPLLGAVRSAVVSAPLDQYEITMHHILEADDGMMMDAYLLKEDGVIRSEDKDLRMTPYPYYDIKTGKIFDTDMFGHLYEDYTPSGTMKCLGHGPKFFWAQMLMGDGADNIKGILTLGNKTCGPKNAFEALHHLKNIEQVANFVIGAYRRIDQNPLPEGYLLWLLRYEGDSFWKYLSELPITRENRQFLDECVKRDWFKPYVAEDEDVPF